ncbi:CAP domain-containing protein [Rhodoflexus sp.]
MKKIYIVTCLISLKLSLIACTAGFWSQSTNTDSDQVKEKVVEVAPPVKPTPPIRAVTLPASIQVRLSQEELKLYRMMMAYRKANGLPEIPLSSALTFVAQTHCKDLEENPDILTTNCNMHSWSNKGKWSPCCYTSDHRASECMWNKPRELTKYTGNGFEISHRRFGADVTAETALNSWRNSPGHNNVILNRDIWKSYKWQAIGIGMSNSFATVWFGVERDAEGSPLLP